MAKSPKLKVFRTAIGFHDAYIAAPSRKAALAAWGSDHDLFARGVAEQVTDAALSSEPLANPGVVIRRSRGTAAEHLAALPKTPPAKRKERLESDHRARAPASTVKRAASVKKAKPARKPPSRAELDEAAEALSAAEHRQHVEDKALRAKEAALAKERRALDQAHARETERLEQRRDAASAAYQRAVRDWQP